MSKGHNHKPKPGEWSKYALNGRIITVPHPCDHFWQSGELADGWERCCLCDLVRMIPEHPESLTKSED